MGYSRSSTLDARRGRRIAGTISRNFLDVLEINVFLCFCGILEVWEAFGKHLEGIWEASGRPL